jgi:hypothetical protein
MERQAKACKVLQKNCPTEQIEFYLLLIVPLLVVTADSNRQNLGMKWKSIPSCELLYVMAD